MFGWSVGLRSRMERRRRKRLAYKQAYPHTFTWTLPQQVLCSMISIRERLFVLHTLVPVYLSASTRKSVRLCLFYCVAIFEHSVDCKPCRQHQRHQQQHTLNASQMSEYLQYAFVHFGAAAITVLQTAAEYAMIFVCTMHSITWDTFAGAYSRTFSWWITNQSISIALQSVSPSPVHEQSIQQSIMCSGIQIYLLCLALVWIIIIHRSIQVKSNDSDEWKIGKQKFEITF